MPASAKRLVALIGYRSTIEFVQAFGGQRIFVSASKACAVRFIAAVGREAADKLMGSWPNGQFEVPQLSRLECALRHAAIRGDAAAGTTFDELVDRYGLSRRHLRKIVSAEASAVADQMAPPAAM